MIGLHGPIDRPGRRAVYDIHRRSRRGLASDGSVAAQKETGLVGTGSPRSMFNENAVERPVAMTEPAAAGELAGGSRNGGVTVGVGCDAGMGIARGMFGDAEIVSVPGDETGNAGMVSMARGVRVTGRTSSTPSWPKR